MSSGRLVIRGAQVWDPDGDVHVPARRDVLVEGARIAAVLPPGDPLTAAWLAADPAPELLEAVGKLLMPGFVNAHFHSYDSLMKGLLEDMPFDVWARHSQPAYFGKRSRAEIRVRTLVPGPWSLIGVIECLKHGITTVQDMNSLVPMQGFRRDFAQVVAANQPAVAHLLEANRRVMDAPLGMERFARS